MKKLVLVWLLVWQMADAQSGPIEITSYGVYDDSSPYSCGKIISDDAIDFGRQHWKTWISGYVTGANAMRWRATRGYDLDGMYFWVLNYCKQNPLDPLLNAFFALDQTLGVGKFPVYSDKFRKTKK